MISTYQVFKIIFGLFVSALVLYFLILYAGNYGQMQKDKQKAIILKNFQKNVKTVYSTGVYMNFTDFSRIDFDLSFDAYEPPGIRSSLGKTPISTPTLFYPEKRLLLDRNYIDLGFFRFYFVEAIPEMRIIFNPLDSSDETWNLMKDIATHLPSTTYITPNITFGFCVGNDISGFWDNYYFSEIVLRQSRTGFVFNPCSVRLVGKKYRLVTISSACSNAFDGICIKPNSDGVGEAFVLQKTFVYKNALDLVALIIGGEGKDIYELSIAENLYEYENRVFATHLMLYSKMMSEKAKLMQDIQNLPSELEECKQDGLYTDFIGNLTTIDDVLSNPNYFKNKMYQNQNDMRDLMKKINEARSAYQSLVYRGCEYETL